MRRFPIPVLLPAALIAVVALVLAGCGGGDEESAAPPEVTTGAEETTTTAEPTGEETEPDAGDEAATSGDARPVPGSGTLRLDDGRSYAITIAECELQPNGTFSVTGTSVEGSEFEMGQFFLGEDWSQSQASLEFPNRDQIYVIVSRATAGAQPASREGSTVRWTQTFRELDESANRHVYTGEGTVALTCP